LRRDKYAAHRSDPPMARDRDPASPPESNGLYPWRLLIAITGSAIAMLFLIHHSKHVFRLSSIHGVHSNFSVPASAVAAAIGVIFGLWGLKCLISGNTRRLRQIFVFTASAAELTASLAAGEEQLDRDLVIENLHDYECALVKLGAYEQALQVSRWIVLSGGRPHINQRRRYPWDDLFDQYFRRPQ
jgi:hypothetical protein